LTDIAAEEASTAAEAVSTAETSVSDGTYELVALREAKVKSAIPITQITVSPLLPPKARHIASRTTQTAR